MLKMKNYIFVYGSLREGFFNFEKYLKGKVISSKLGKVSGKALYHMPSKGYPAMIKGSNYVFGEVFEIKDFDTNLKKLDELEDYLGENKPENEYNRELLQIELIGENEPKFISAYVYMYNLSKDKEFANDSVLIEHGDWKKFMTDNK